jgi:hypothetical protein
LWNHEVLTNIEGVWERIAAALNRAQRPLILTFSREGRRDLEAHALSSFPRPSRERVRVRVTRERDNDLRWRRLSIYPSIKARTNSVSI